MSDMRNLYQEVILDHNKKPRNFRAIENCTHHAHGFNPLCGDDFKIYAIVNNDTISDLSFEGTGCAISKAAASMMTSRIKGKSVEEAEVLIDAFRKLMTNTSSDEEKNILGHLKVFEGVAQLPSRIKCAVLPWHALYAALHNEQESSTEGDHDKWEKE